MELNSINKTGTWSEAVDRLNNNFSKTSTEVEKVKQNAIRNKGLFSTLDSLKAAVSHLQLWATGLSWGIPYPVLYINVRREAYGAKQEQPEAVEVLTFPAS